MEEWEKVELEPEQEQHVEVSDGAKALFFKADAPKLLTKCPCCLDGLHVQMKWRHSSDQESWQMVKAAPPNKEACDWQNECAQNPAMGQY